MDPTSLRHLWVCFQNLYWSYERGGKITARGSSQPRAYRDLFLVIDVTILKCVFDTYKGMRRWPRARRAEWRWWWAPEMRSAPQRRGDLPPGVIPSVSRGAMPRSLA